MKAKRNANADRARAWRVANPERVKEQIARRKEPKPELRRGSVVRDREYILARVTKTTGGCWIWAQATRRKYGAASTQDRTVVQAHRFSFELFVGPIPSGMTLDHLCRDTRCVNPEHLEPVSLQENLRRGRDARGRSGFTSKYKGVFVRRGERGWCAQIWVNGKNVRLGSHATEEAAAVAYNNAAKKQFGDGAQLNSIEASR